jgi:hypothetical protein
MPKEIRGVDTNPPQGQRMPLGRSEVVGSRTETIRPGKYGNGQDREGTPSGAENRDAKRQRYRDGATHRAGLRDSKY